MNMFYGYFLVESKFWNIREEMPIRVPYAIAMNSFKYKIWGSQSSVAEDTGLVGCDTVAGSAVLMFQKIILSSCSGLSIPRRTATWNK
jgi:hypothetical protein